MQVAEKKLHELQLGSKETCKNKDYGTNCAMLLVKMCFHDFSVLSVSGAERCHFPEEWRGRWYQGGLGEVVIKESAISKKGVCRTHKDSFYVLEDK